MAEDRRTDIGPPNYEQFLPPIIKSNYGKWKYHEIVKPGVMVHVSETGDKIYTVRAASGRLLAVDKIRKYCDLADKYCGGYLRFTSRNNVEFLLTDEANIDPLIAERLSLPVDRGALVQRVVPGGPADLAGLRAYQALASAHELGIFTALTGGASSVPELTAQLQVQERGIEVSNTGAAINVPVGTKTLGRIMDVLGKPTDNAGDIGAEMHLPIHRPPPSYEDQAATTELLETGIKVVDLIMPITVDAMNGMRAAVAAGVPHSVPSFTVNKVCGSGLKTVALAGQAVSAPRPRCPVTDRSQSGCIRGSTSRHG